MALGWRKEYSRYKGFFLNIVDLYKQKKDLMMFLEILLSLATVSLFSVFAIKPTAITIIDLLKEIKAREETIAKMDTKLTNLKSAQQNYSNEAEKIQLLDTAVPQRPAPETFVRQVQGISATDGVFLNGASVNEVTLLGEVKKRAVKPGEETMPAGAEGLSFFLNFNSDFDSINNLLSDLEYLRRPIKITTINISKQKSEELVNISGALDFTLSGEVPYTTEGNTNQENTNQ